MKLLNHREQAWENVCSTFVRDLGYHNTPNELSKALFLARTLARAGFPVQLHSQKIQHHFGHWLPRSGGTTWGVVRREEETVTAVQIEGLLLFPSGSGSTDHVLRQAHDRQVVHYACHLLTEAGLPCDGRRSFSGYPRSDIPNGYCNVNHFDVCFYADHGRGFSKELNLSGVGALFGWSYQTGDRHNGRFQERRSNNWFPLSTPRPDNVLNLSQTLASAIREHRLEQALSPALSVSKRRF